MTQTQPSEPCDPPQLRLVSLDDTQAIVPSPKKERPRNLVWDALEALFGFVPPGTSAFGKRTKAVKDLKLMEATPDEIHRAKAEFHKAFPACRCTDMALAMHFPILRPKKITPPCGECGIGGGMHAADCSHVT